MELCYPPAFRPPGVIWRFSLQRSLPWAGQQGSMVSEQAGAEVSPGHVDTQGISGALAQWGQGLRALLAQSCK